MLQVPLIVMFMIINALKRFSFDHVLMLSKYINRNIAVTNILYVGRIATSRRALR